MVWLLSPLSILLPKKYQSQRTAGGTHELSSPICRRRKCIYVCSEHKWRLCMHNARLPCFRAPKQTLRFQLTKIVRKASRAWILLMVACMHGRYPGINGFPSMQGMHPNLYYCNVHLSILWQNFWKILQAAHRVYGPQFGELLLSIRMGARWSGQGAMAIFLKHCLWQDYILTEMASCIDVRLSTVVSHVCHGNAWAQQWLCSVGTHYDLCLISSSFWLEMKRTNVRV